MFGLEGQRLQVEHQLGVRVERGRNVGGALGQLDVHRLGLRVLDALFDLAHGVEILVQLGLVTPAEAVRHAVGFFADGVEDAALRLAA